MHTKRIRRSCKPPCTGCTLKRVAQQVKLFTRNLEVCYLLEVVMTRQAGVLSKYTAGLCGFLLGARSVWMKHQRHNGRMYWLLDRSTCVLRKPEMQMDLFKYGIVLRYLVNNYVQGLRLFSIIFTLFTYSSIMCLSSNIIKNNIRIYKSLLNFMSIKDTKQRIRYVKDL